MKIMVTNWCFQFIKRNFLSVKETKNTRVEKFFFGQDGVIEHALNIEDLLLNNYTDYFKEIPKKNYPRTHYLLLFLCLTC
jgi:hypothetical protein